MTAHLPHVTSEDVTETRRPTAEQARALRLLEYGTPGAALVRLSLRDWAHVDRAVAALARMGAPAAHTDEGDAA